MIKRVTIYGDSFADPGWNNEHPTWHGRLRDRWPEIKNHGKSGSGPMYSFKQFYEDLSTGFNYEDLIVFVISGAPRIHFSTPAHRDDIHQWNNKICRDLDTGDSYPLVTEDKEYAYNQWFSFNKDKARFAVDTFRDETVYGNWKYESLLYTVSRIQKCKVFIWYLSMYESYIQTSLNDEYFYIHDEDLEDAVKNEYVEEERGQYRNDLNYNVNHFTEANHEIMYKQVVNFVDGREIPKFLQGICKGQYNKDEFIYD